MSDGQDAQNKVSDAFAHPIAIILVPVLCAAWLWLGYPVDGLTLGLSIIAISTTQLVLVGQNNSEAAVQRKLDEIVRAVPDADSSLAGEPDLE